MKRGMLFATLTLSLLSFSAQATPPVGTKLPNVRIEDPWDRTTTLERFAGKPVLVLYEDKESVGLNRPLKEELAQLAKGDRYRSRAALVAIADVSSYDFWPVRGFVKDAIKSESNKQKTVIYCDWDGRVRTKLGLTRATSNVVLLGKDHQVLFSHAGVLSRDQQAELIELLRREVNE